MNEKPPSDHPAHFGPLHPGHRATVEAWLEHAGWWYPPDAIDAVHEGRDTYHALDPNITWSTSRAREPIQRAIEQARKQGWKRPRALRFM